MPELGPLLWSPAPGGDGNLWSLASAEQEEAHTGERAEQERVVDDLQTTGQVHRYDAPT